MVFVFCHDLTLSRKTLEREGAEREAGDHRQERRVGVTFARVKYTLNSYCVAVYGSIFIVFSAFFRSDCPIQNR